MTPHSPRATASLEYRARGIPVALDANKVRDVISQCLDLPPGATLRVDSLALDPYSRETRVATISFSRNPDRLVPTNEVNEWNFECSNESGEVFQITLDTHFLGFTPLGPISENSCSIDIIAVTGLGGHAFGSFKKPNGRYMWLRDSLAKDFPNARILVFGYESRLEDPDSFQNLRDLGLNFRSAIATIRHYTLYQNMSLYPFFNPKRPMILIGHSLGGIVIKQALIEMETGDASAKANLISICGILFFGVPSQGMEISSLVPIVGDHSNRALLESLGKGSVFLQMQKERFEKLFDTERFPVIYFYETKKSPTAVHVGGKWRMAGPPEVLVDKDSATDGREDDPGEGDPDLSRRRPFEPIHRTHSELVKYREHDEYYQRVKQCISKLESEMSKENMERPEQKQELQAETDACMRSLAFPEMHARKTEIEVAEDTCKWLLNEEKFKAWFNQDGGLLWISGNPGTGKSALMKFAVVHVETTAKKEAIKISFFFNSQGSPLQRSKLGFLRALLHQLLPHYPRKLSELTETYERRCATQGAPEIDWDWHEKELEKLLIQLLVGAAQRDSIYLFADALDECGEQQAQELVELFETVMERHIKQKAKLKILIACRQYNVIHLDRIVKVIPEESNNEDIRTVVFQSLRNKALSNATTQQLGDEIVANANGVFLWAVLVTSRVVTLSRQGRSIAAIRGSIKKIPKMLHELYETIFYRPSGDDDDEDLFRTIKLLQWVCFAEHRLSIQELQHAMAIDPESAYTTADDYLQEPDMAEDEGQMVRMINYLSKGLVEVKSGYVQAIHQTVNNFLVDYALPSLSVRVGMSCKDYTGQGHLVIFRTCLRYLSLREICTLKDDRSRNGLDILSPTGPYPLLSYATTCWIFHASHIGPAGSVDDKLLQFLYRTFSAQNFDNWVWLHREIRESAGVRAGHVFGTSLLHVATAFNIPSLVGTLTKESGNDPNRTDYDGRTPLWWAVSRLDERQILILLQDERVDPNLADKEGKSPLHIAVKDKRILKALLSSPKVFPNPKDCKGWTPLFYACNHPECVELLLSHDTIDCDTQDDLGRTVMWWAVHSQRFQVLRLILHRADPNLGDLNGVTPIFLACWRGYNEIVALLLSNSRTRPEIKTASGRTPLWAAATYKRNKIAQLLLSTGMVNPGTKDSNGRSPLDVAEDNSEFDYSVMQSSMKREGNFSIEPSSAKGSRIRPARPKRRYTPPTDADIHVADIFGDKLTDGMFFNGQSWYEEEINRNFSLLQLD